MKSISLSMATAFALLCSLLFFAGETVPTWVHVGTVITVLFAFVPASLWQFRQGMLERYPVRP